ncbi:hypothetical protein PTTG_26702 [Puccinia triticina 1-1 BBBD Race 1]|uniref:Uncharacterized protein n=1 Tax=Puccinia triticina (isolate 1-1 / race 1 (BBBD)) TaxID=630390 RepID=A0A180GTI1_PUCT1|nr:hypothetical protein PTTG_26702 [Puccinia triticina 1-1 BBBD Race 1]
MRAAASGPSPNPANEPDPAGTPAAADARDPAVHSQESAGDQRQPTLGRYAKHSASVAGKGPVPKKGVLTRSAAKIGVPPDSDDTEVPAAATAPKVKGPAQKTAEGLPETICLLGDHSGPKEKNPTQEKGGWPSKRATIMAKALAATKAGNQEQAAMLWEVYKAVAFRPTPEEPPKTIPAKHAREGSIEILGQPKDRRDEPPEDHKVVVVQEGDLQFAVNETNSHKDVGFTPYFNKNLKELRAPLPLTIFNKKWQDRAILHYAEKRPKGDESSSESRNQYTGLPYPSEWVQTFSEWAMNHQGFYTALRDVYQFRTIAGWVLIHKGHCDRILAQHGFMAALQYNVNVRSTVFAHRVMVNGNPTMADISVFRQDIAEETYSDARNFGEIGMTDNLYAKGGLRVGWDPLMGAPKQSKGPGQKTGFNRSSASDNTSQPNQGGPKSNQSGGYKGKKFNPHHKEQSASAGGSSNTPKAQETTP